VRHLVSLFELLQDPYGISTEFNGTLDVLLYENFNERMLASIAD
jgi:hypothetical protein